MGNNVVAAGVIVIIIVAFALLIQKNENEPINGAIKIGAVLPITGDAAFWGENTRNGILLAAEDINSKGGINGKQVEIILEDSQCDPKLAVNAVQKLINVDKIDALIGDICSGATLAIAPIAEENKKVLIAPCPEADAISKAGDYIFRTWVPNGQQGRDVARYASQNLQIKTVGILARNDDFGSSLLNAFADEFEKSGGLVILTEKYEKGGTDFRTSLIKIKGKQPDAIFIITFGPDNINIIEQIHELGINTKILSSGTINSPEFLNPLGNLSEGIVFADLQDATTTEFRDRYSKAYGKEWPGAQSCAGVGYDDVAIVADAIKTVGADGEKIKQHLYSLNNFPGVSGPITFDKNGDLKREYSIFVVDNGSPKKL